MKGEHFTAEDTTGIVTTSAMQIFEDRLAAVRESVGENINIIVDNHARSDLLSAIQLGKIAKKYNVLFIEEPTKPDSKVNRYLVNSIDTPISYGERLYSRCQYRPFLEDGLLRIIQPDIGNCGGITEARKICDFAYTYDTAVQLHICGSPLLTAASMQLEAVIPNFAIHEHHVFNRFSYNKKLCIYDYQPKNGYIKVPDIPGLGNELSDLCFEIGTVKTIC